MRLQLYNQSMRFALLGYDSDAYLLVRWLVDDGQHELMFVIGAGGAANLLLTLIPGVQVRDSWEELLLGSTVDVVIFARGEQTALLEHGLNPDDLRADQLRKLAQAAVPMLVVCPACDAIIGFEIEMIRRDVGGLIWPYVPGQHHPAIRELACLVERSHDSPLGQLEQVTFDREQSRRDRVSVLQQLSRDFALLRSLVGTLQSVSGSGPARDVGRDPLGPKLKELPALANLSVALTSESRLPARWSISPPTTGDLGRLTLIGQRGKAILTMPAEGDWSLDIAGDTYSTTNFASDADLSEVFQQLSQNIQSVAATAASPWISSCRDQEAAEAVDRSLSRGRTIELFNEEHTEEASFKGVMAMGGCLLLACALVIVLFAAVVEGLHLPMRNWPVWRLWPVYLLAAIGLFLLLQLFRLAVKRPELRSSSTLPDS